MGSCNHSLLYWYRSVSTYFSQTIPQKCRRYLKVKIKTLAFVLCYHAYLAFAVYYNRHKNWDYCSGVGAVLTVTGVAYASVILPLAVRTAGRMPPVRVASEWVRSNSKGCRICVQAGFLIAIGIFLILDTVGECTLTSLV